MLSGKAREVVLDYLNRGGRVYQSYYNDFGTNITAGEDTLIDYPVMTAHEPVGLLESLERIRIPGQVTFRKTSFSAPALSHIALRVRQYEDPDPGTCTLLSQQVGKGTYYYFSGNLEKSLSAVYNPWNETDAHRLYSILRPESDLEIDNKHIEFYLKSDGNRRIVMLLNHSGEYQPVTITTKSSMNLVNFETKSLLGHGKEITFLLKPAEVIIGSLEKK
jgi:hypothetical protein